MDQPQGATSWTNRREQPHGPTAGSNLMDQPQGVISWTNRREQPHGPTAGSNLMDQPHGATQGNSRRVLGTSRREQPLSRRLPNVQYCCIAPEVKQCCRLKRFEKMFVSVHRYKNIYHMALVQRYCVAFGARANTTYTPVPANGGKRGKAACDI
jgi:hypothetical protein